MMSTTPIKLRFLAPIIGAMPRPTTRIFLLALSLAYSSTSIALCWSFGSHEYGVVGAGHGIRRRLRHRRVASSTGRSVPVRRFMTEREEENGENYDDDDIVDTTKHSGYNVLGSELACCCSDVGGSGIGTGFYRNGLCGECAFGGM